jgi:heme exporter protein C
MIFLLLISFIYAIKYLRSNDLADDYCSISFANIGILFGVLGILTGSLWAKFTWGAFWTNDPKLNGAAIGLLIYLAYLILRGSFQDYQQKARISAVYNIFAYLVLIPLLFVLPRLTDSLHPGNGGNPGFNSYDLDNKMRLIFYPAVIGWILLGVWIAQIKVRILKIEDTLNIIA